ncbi:MAG: DNAase [Zetaproteobacteria bacterium CG12_big_fil_rev_8_21_14_0_65_55_1124]|nr:MAG: DNAase [Zetaproteobacteria bacterium CG1_02_55_237]PIS18748.1 MAG: DNAase [Zetaproteobacteria bacterium CG08_land_8_20_14_0_20_55_17]PIW43980.1 MAG: DNAase [Zetaproteobacteria bacterium CG12_big_fil_rev_8_21_14_0_65_55_1124]PIY52475.1 MAG: DNAase [Zetaproteobacteria bacterium CG_4_10_14_0_8_um_filter_55_43]PIZ36754.1 MAG: DNAase [Zetaproteobacteria bacterium CG_4_10_14_0_2_um_filter_55_20]PJB81068.1 MAG: DNAase [Zetaproteobacteria bacterium CG_4_9_14_0_8_um_filter_55_31]
MSAFRLVDSHCHPDFHQFDEDRDAMLARYAEAGGQWLMAVAVDLENIPRLRSLAEARDHVFFSVGVHPNHEVEVEPTFEQLCRLADHPKCVAIGETGMDFFRHRVEPSLQEARFRTHLRAARAVDKPVIVHMRDADSDTLRVLEEEGANECGGVMHCFSSSREVAERALDMGLSISFSGNVTYKANEELRAVAAFVPEEALLVETDAPYLAPLPHRGKRNEPAYVQHVIEGIAGVRGLTPEYVAELSHDNACRRFGVTLQG